jgi:hypothetical protein
VYKRKRKHQIDAMNDIVKVRGLSIDPMPMNFSPLVYNFFYSAVLT